MRSMSSAALHSKYSQFRSPARPAEGGSSAHSILSIRHSTFAAHSLVLQRSAVILGVVGAFALAPCLAREPMHSDPAQVKVIAFGGEPTRGSSGPCNPGEMDEKRVWQVDTVPVDGLLFNLSLQSDGKTSSFFTSDCFRRPYTYAEMAPELARWKALRFRNVTHNFVRLNLGTIQADWYDDKAWGVIADNMKLASRAMQEVGAAGVMIDTEQYNDQPLNYMLQSHRTEKSFDEYRAQVRKRGAEMMKALGSSFPHPTIMLTFGNAAVATAGEQTPLYARGMGLWPAFMDGMMDADPDAEFIDGYEQAYEYRSYAQFKAARAIIKDKAAEVSQDPKRYRQRIKAGFGLWLHSTNNVISTDFSKNNKSPEEWKHAIHYAMLLSDGYIWLYNVPWGSLPKEYWEATKAARLPQALDFKPLERPWENQPAAYILSAKGRPDCDDKIVFASLRNAGYTELYDFPKQWKFRLDPQNAGLKQKWFKTYRANEWMDLEIGEWWEPQLKTTYLGYAWYRIEWEAPKEWAGRKLVLAFGAVDEDGWMWLNGEPLGDHAIGPDAWNTPFELDLTGKLKPGARNTLCVRVHNSAGVGGIWKSVKVFAK